MINTGHLGAQDLFRVRLSLQKMMITKSKLELEDLIQEEERDLGGESEGRKIGRTTLILFAMNETT